MLFGKVNVPLLGVAENMSYFEDANGRRQYLFGQGGGLRTAGDLGAEFLGEIPLGPEGAVRAMHPDFVIFGSANERFRIHPFLQHQPVAEVHAVDSLVDA